MYSIVKGNLFRAYTGTQACTGIVVHAVVNDKVEARRIVKELVDTETDLVIVIDLATGKQCEDV